MEFRFDLQPIFTQPIVKVNSNLLPHTFRGDRRGALDTTTKIAEIINTMGELSAKAQGLTKPVTTAQKLRMSDQNIYLLGDLQSGKTGAVVGLLKVGKKSLYVFDDNGETKMVNAPCVLDFYVHESRQRAGLGKDLFETMLEDEKFIPEKMAVDRPSDKLLGFLRKHYGLEKTIPQMNNFVVYDGFFERPNINNNQEVEGGVHITDSPNTALFGPQYTNDDKRKLKLPQKSSTGSIPQIQSSPVGRYAAPRPMCSMAQCLTSEGAPRAIRSAASKSSVSSRSPNQIISDSLNQKNQSNVQIQENVIPEESNERDCPTDIPSEVFHNCNIHGGQVIMPTENQLGMSTPNIPSQTETYVAANNVAYNINQNEQHLPGTQSPQETLSKILIQRKLAEKRTGLQGTTMDTFCASNTSIQTCGMDNPAPLGLTNDLFSNPTLSSPNDYYNRQNNPSNPGIVKTDESQSHLQSTQNVNPSEPIEETRVKQKEICSEGGTNAAEATNLEEFQEVCPKCSTTFISSRASSARKGNTLQAKPSRLSQKSVHQINDMIIHSSATPATGEPNREL